MKYFLVLLLLLPLSGCSSYYEDYKKYKAYYLQMKNAHDKMKDENAKLQKENMELKAKLERYEKGFKSMYES